MRADDPTVAAAKTGDPDAWRALHRAHAGRLLLWLRRRCPGEAEDIAGETWLTAASRVNDFTGTSDDFAGWLFGISRNLEANARRRTARRRTEPVDALETVVTGASVTVPGPEPAYAERDWVRALLAGLPDRERDVVTCLDVLGLDVAATAEALGISPVAVRVARHRGLKRLRATATRAVTA